LYVHANSSIEPVEAGLTHAVQAADRSLAVREVTSLKTLAERLVWRERLLSSLTATFGALAVFVACLGLYGTISYSVARRTNEIGVRLALGATPRGVSWIVLRETLTLVVVGGVIGLALAFGKLQYAQTLLYGLSPRDPQTMAIAGLGLVAVGILAGLLPAWRASRVDPLTALRAD
jgi:ABC-type antimicrobial peptide transport system permease subunit